MGRRKQKTGKWESISEGFKTDTARVIAAVALFALSIFLIFAAVGFAGIAGSEIFHMLFKILGIGYVVLPVLCIVIGWASIGSVRGVSPLKGIGAFVFLLSILGLLSLLSPHAGGALGLLLATPLVGLFDIYSSLLILWTFILISSIVLLEVKLEGLEFPFFANVWGRLHPSSETATAVIGDVEPDEEEVDADDIPEPTPPVGTGEMDETKTKEEATPFVMRPLSGEYTFPPLSLLEKDRGKPGVGDIKANANIIKRTMQNFGINVEIDEISIGPSVTRYALKPAEGVRLSKIVSLQTNLELALAAHPVRIEAPIPGRSLVGIEVPNTAKTTVGLGTLLGNEEFQNAEKALLVALGKDISGKSHYTDLAKMPHLLIAGTTGSGKSVTIHAIIMSLLYRCSPQNLRFIMVDPKRVELTLYNNIPHLLTPVITDAKKAILALKWAAKEMDRRYDILETESVRDISSYHKNILAPALEKERNPEEAPPETMPYIVIVIDELADIMQAYPRELEASVVRLAQMSRAVGIHLILSTQRPSVNVITGLIKANIPARVALQVLSQIDSRTILDAGGAEKLLGAGDMLYLSGDMAKPLRIQSAYVSEGELKKVTSFITKENEQIAPEAIDLAASTGSTAISDSSFDDGDDDDLYEEAKSIVMEAGKASTSYLQRKLRVGYARAARLMDLLEERGVIGPADGSKPRDVVRDGSAPSETPSEEL